MEPLRSHINFFKHLPLLKFMLKKVYVRFICLKFLFKNVSVCFNFLTFNNPAEIILIRLFKYSANQYFCKLVAEKKKP
jgi:hypothetical protein